MGLGIGVLGFGASYVGPLKTDKAPYRLLLSLFGFMSGVSFS